MLGLPKQTEVNREISKIKITKNLGVSKNSKAGKLLTEQVEKVIWRNKLSPDTLPLEKGKDIDEVQVFEIAVKTTKFDPIILKYIDQIIPYAILFIVTEQEQKQAWIAYKKVTDTGDNASVYSEYYHTQWFSEEDLKLELQGHSVDEIYEGFIRQVAKNKISQTTGKDIETDIVQSKE